jgi:hypothetical protein
VKTVAKIADHVGQEYKGGGITRTEVMKQAAVIIPMLTRPQATIVYDSDGSMEKSRTPPDILDGSDYQNAKKIADYHRFRTRRRIVKRSSRSCGSNARNQCTRR